MFHPSQPSIKVIFYSLYTLLIYRYERKKIYNWYVDELLRHLYVPANTFIGLSPNKDIINKSPTAKAISLTIYLIYIHLNT